MAKTKKLITLSKAIEDNSLVEVVQYQPIGFKIAMVEEIVDACGGIEDGVYITDCFSKEIVMKLKFLANYTNINLEKIDAFKTYDKISETGFFDNLLKENPQAEVEYNLICKLIDAKADEESKKHNSIEAVLLRKLEEIASKIPEGEEFDKKIALATEKINGLNPDSLEFIKSAMGAFKVQ